MNYPGRLIKIGETDQAIVVAIVNALAGFGYRLAAANTGFDASVGALVKLFQSQHFDAGGLPLKVDGKVGPMTWGALFGTTTTSMATGLAAAALAEAVTQIGVMEQPPGSNRGPQVDAYLIEAGAPVGSFWCMAFVYWCFKHGGANQGIANIFPKTAGCLDAWNRVRTGMPSRILTKARALADPTLVKPGMVFILDHGGGLGHTGIIASVSGGSLATVEGNSNPNGSSNGIGVFALNRRKITDGELKGFLDFT